MSICSTTTEHILTLQLSVHFFFLKTVPQHHVYASLVLTPNQQLAASDFYSLPYFFYLSPPLPFRLYSALAWHHILQEPPYLLHLQSLFFVHLLHSHQSYLCTHKFENVICLFRKLNWLFIASRIKKKILKTFFRM